MDHHSLGSSRDQCSTATPTSATRSTEASIASGGDGRTAVVGALIDALAAAHHDGRVASPADLEARDRDILKAVVLRTAGHDPTFGAAIVRALARLQAGPLSEILSWLVVVAETGQIPNRLGANQALATFAELVADLERTDAKLGQAERELGAKDRALMDAIDQVAEATNRAGKAVEHATQSDRVMTALRSILGVAPGESVLDHAKRIVVALEAERARWMPLEAPYSVGCVGVYGVTGEPARELSDREALADLTRAVQAAMRRLETAQTGTVPKPGRPAY